MPAYNEAGYIGTFIKQINQLSIRQEFDLLVIDDGSEDNTAGIAEDNGARVISHIYNLGYASALQTAYKYAVEQEYTWLIQIDSDGQHDCRNIELIYEVLQKENAPDIVIGSRFLSDENKLQAGKLKKAAIRFLRFIIKRSTGAVISDPTSGLQGMNRKAFAFNAGYQNFFPEYPDANMIIQMLLNDFAIEEIGAVMYERTTGKSMHSGIEPVFYAVYMLLSSIAVMLRSRRRSKSEYGKKRSHTNAEKK